MTTYDDLKELTGQSDWFATIVIPAPSGVEDARARFEVEWRNARRQFSDGWDVAELEQLDEFVAELHHGDSESLLLIHPRGGTTFVELLRESVAEVSVHEGQLPRLASVIDSRQRVIAHVVVEADRTGANLTAFDGGDVLATEKVEGSTLHIHRGHPGGWSQRRFQQRAENKWEENAREVADAVTVLANDVDAQLVAVAGDIRAQMFILESLPTDIANKAVRIEAGSPEGIADEVGRLLATKVAERVTEAAQKVRAAAPHGTGSTDASEIEVALRDGRVACLLVHDEGSDEAGESADGRLVDRAIVAALATDAEVLVVPNLAMLDGPLAALMRW